MDGLKTKPMVPQGVVGAFITCVLCGTVEEIHVPREEGLRPKIYWECPACQMRVDGDGRTGLA
jgi:hypothetical protein